MAVRFPIFLVSMVMHAWLVPLTLSASLPIVDPGLFVIQGVETCGLGSGYCLLSNSCLVDADFQPDIEGGHCAGLRNAFTPVAEFICCRFEPPPTTVIPEDEESTESSTDETTVVQQSSSEASHRDESSENSQETSTTTSTTNVVTSEKAASAPSTTRRLSLPFDVFSKTNQLLHNIQHLLEGGRMRPSVAAQKEGHGEGLYNDKSIVQLILLGLNETIGSG